jgi:hypothetical protein
VYGHLRIFNTRPPRFTVNLIGGEQFPEVITETGGRFEFKNVPLGKYEIKAEGNLSGSLTPKEGTLAIVLEKPADYKEFEVVLKDAEPD